MEKLKKFFTSSLGIGLIFFLGGAYYHAFFWNMLAFTGYYPGVKIPLAQLPLQLIVSGMPAYILLLLVSLGSRNPAMIVGGGIGVVAGDLINKYVYMQILHLDFMSPMTDKLAYMPVKLLFPGLLLGWLWSKIFRHGKAALVEQAPAAQLPAGLAAQIPPAPTQISGARIPPPPPSNATPTPPSPPAAAQPLPAPQQQTIPRMLPAWLTPWRAMFALGLVTSVLPVTAQNHPTLAAIASSILFNGFAILIWAFATRKNRSASFVIVSGIPLLLFNLDYIMKLYFTPRSGGAVGVAMSTMFFPIISTLLVLPVSLAIGALAFGVETLVLKHVTNQRILLHIRHTLLALGMAALFLLPMASQRTADKSNVAKRIGQARVVNNDGQFTKSVPPLKDVRQDLGDYDDDGEDEVAEISRSGISLLNYRDLSQKAFIPAATTDYSYKPARLRKGGDLLLFKSNDCSLYDLKGNAIWTFQYGKTKDYTDSLSADLDNDGETEFYCPTENGLYRLDANGKNVWRTEKSPYDLFLLPDIGSGAGRILINESNGYKLLDTDGKTTAEFQLSKSNSWPSLLRCATGYCLAAGKPSYDGPETDIYDLTGKPVMQVKVNKDLGYKEAFSVKFEPDKPPYLVVRSGVGGQVHQSGIDIFTSDGKLVYSEILPDWGNIFAVPDFKNGHGYVICNKYKYSKEAPAPGQDCPLTVGHEAGYTLLSASDAAFTNGNYREAAARYEAYSDNCPQDAPPAAPMLKALEAYNRALAAGSSMPAEELEQLKTKSAQFEEKVLPKLLFATRKEDDDKMRMQATKAIAGMAPHSSLAVRFLGAILLNDHDKVRNFALNELDSLGARASLALPDLENCCKKKASFSPCCRVADKVKKEWEQKELLRYRASQTGAPAATASTVGAN